MALEVVGSHLLAAVTAAGHCMLAMAAVDFLLLNIILLDHL